MSVRCPSLTCCPKRSHPVRNQIARYELRPRILWGQSRATLASRFESLASGRGSRLLQKVLWLLEVFQQKFYYAVRNDLPNFQDTSQ